MIRSHDTILEHRLQANLRRLRLERGLSQKDLAENAGIGGGNGAYIAQIETGARGLGFVSVEKIAAAFGVDPAVLYSPVPGAEEDPRPGGISTKNAPAAVGPYSQGRTAGGFLFISGQLPLDPETGKIVPGGIAQQTDRVLLNFKAILQAGGGRNQDVVKTTVYLADMSLFAEMNAVYASHFPGAPPARATVPAPGLPYGALVEIEGVAHILS